jgi:hypothetical protein
MNWGSELDLSGQFHVIEQAGARPDDLVNPGSFSRAIGRLPVILARHFGESPL